MTNEQANNPPSTSPKSVNPSIAPLFVDHSGNEINRDGKILAGFLLVLFTLLSALYIIAYWPDTLPDPKSRIAPLYTYQCFNVRLIDTTKYVPPASDSATRITVTQGQVTLADSAVEKPAAGIGKDSADSNKANVPAVRVQQAHTELAHPDPYEDAIHLNTLLLLLVAAGGILGNMIFLASSFTAYVGAGKFKRSWILWYCVKPFTAAALALGIYFVFRGGMLNMSNDSTNINLYGVMTLSLLAGLSTDRASQKLRELFDVLMKPKEERPDSMDAMSSTVTEARADVLEIGKPVLITLVGKNLTNPKLEVFIEDQPITGLQRKNDEISFSYTLPEKWKDKTALVLLVKNVKGGPVKFELKTKAATGPGSSAAESQDQDKEDITDISDVLPDGKTDENENQNPIKE